jgi:hypothetical protein
MKDSENPPKLLLITKINLTSLTVTYKNVDKILINTGIKLMGNFSV